MSYDTTKTIFSIHYEEVFLSSIETKDEQAVEATATQSERVAHRFRTWSGTLWQVFRYCLVGGLNTLADLLVLNILLWRFPTHNVQVLVVYNSIAYVGGAASSFFLNKYWTFRHTQRTTTKEVRRFVSSILLELIYSNAFIWFAGKALQPFIENATLWGNAVKLVAIVSGVVLSYSLMRFWTFAGLSKGDRKTDKLL